MIKMESRSIGLLDVDFQRDRKADSSIWREDLKVNCQDFIEKLWHSISKLQKYDGNFSLYFF